MKFVLKIRWFLFVCLFVFLQGNATVKSLQSCLTLCDPIPGFLQARVVEWGAIAFSVAR